MDKLIFIVDDLDANLVKAEEALEDDYNLMTLPSAEKMFDKLQTVIPDMILLDIEMPQMSGFEAIKILKTDEKYENIPVIFLTSLSDETVEAHGFELGAIDFINKPFSTPVLLNRLATHLKIDEAIKERTKKVVRLQNGIIDVVADIVENRDEVTGGHVERTCKYIRVILDELIARNIYLDEISEWNLDVATSSARMHDVGKINIPDEILNKPGKLTDEEFDIMKTHTKVGEAILDRMIEKTGEAAFLNHAKKFAGYHHEKWDGSGYPYGLKEQDIPLQGRLMAIADVYDALVSERPYKPAFGRKKTEEIILSERGKLFDPVLVDIFMDKTDAFHEICQSIKFDVKTE